MHRFLIVLLVLTVLMGIVPAAMAAPETCADLRVLDLTFFGPQTLAPGDVLGGRLTVFFDNVGDAAAPTFSVGFYLSTDPEITESDLLLSGGREFLNGLDRHGLEAVPGGAGMSVPGSWPGGSAYLGVILDEYDAVSECSEIENTAAIPINVIGGSPSTRHVPGGYGSIVAAITAAAPGDTIQIAAGEYNEAITVAKNLTIIGAGWDQTIIKTNSGAGAIMTVTYADVLIENLQFWSSFGEYFVGKAIDATNSSMMVRDCKFVEINQFNIELTGGSLAVDNIEITRVMGGSDIGVRVFNAVFSFRNSYGGRQIDHIFDAREISLGLVENNIIDGSTVHFAQGVRMMGETIGIIRNNLMIGQHDINTLRTHQPAGIALFDDAYAEISNNEIHEFVYGLYFAYNADARVYDNILTENAYVGVCANLETPAYDGSTPDLGGGIYGSPGHNIIRDNADYNVQNKSSSVVFAKSNDWGLTDSAAIAATLYDYDEDPTLGQVIFTPSCTFVSAGEWKAVDLAFNVATLFEEITSEGFVYIDLDPVGPPLPDWLRAVSPDGPQVYDIHTSASYTGLIAVSIPYDDASLTDERNLTMQHFGLDRWADITSSVDVDNNIVSGTTTSLSPFIIAQPAECCADIRGNTNADAGENVNISDITYLVNYLFGIPLGPAPPCPEEGNANADAGGNINISDITYLVEYLFGIPLGPPPPACP